MRGVQFARPIKNNYDWTNISFGIFALLSCSIHQVIWGGSFTPIQNYIVTAVILTVFLNTTHVGFSFSTMFWLPEARSWCRARFGTLSAFYSWAAIVSIVFIVTIALSFELFSGAVRINASTGLVVMKVITFVSIWHNMAQSMGLSLCYTYAVTLDQSSRPEELNGVHRLAKLERWTVRISFIIVVFLIFGGPDYIASLSNLNSSLVWQLCIFGDFAILSYLLFSLRKFPKRSRKNKILFCVRYYLWPLLTTFRGAVWAFQAVHGVEYYLVNRKMQSRSSMSDTERRKLNLMFYVFGMTFFVFGVFEIDSIGSLLVEFYRINPVPIVIVSSISTGLFLTHFIWDRYFFRFRDEVGRATSGRLLLGTGE